MKLKQTKALTIICCTLGVLKKMSIRPILAKVPILKEVTSEKCNSGELNTFTTYLSSLLGLIAEYTSNHVQKFRTNMLFNWSEFHLSKMTCYKIHALIGYLKYLAQKTSSLYSVNFSKIMKFSILKFVKKPFY